MLETFHSDSRPDLRASLSAKLSLFAKDSGLVQRVSKKFSPEGFLLAMLEATATGRASFNQLVLALGWQSPSLGTSPHALHQRTNRTECGVEGFLVRCLSPICGHRAGAPRAVAHKFPFGTANSSTLQRLMKRHSGRPSRGNASTAVRFGRHSIRHLEFFPRWSHWTRLPPTDGSNTNAVRGAALADFSHPVHTGSRGQIVKDPGIDEFSGGGCDAGAEVRGARAPIMAVAAQLVGDAISLVVSAQIISPPALCQARQAAIFPHRRQDNPETRFWSSGNRSSDWPRPNYPGVAQDGAGGGAVNARGLIHGWRWKVSPGSPR